MNKYFRNKHAPSSYYNKLEEYNLPCKLKPNGKEIVKIRLMRPISVHLHRLQSDASKISYVVDITTYNIQH